jgi:tetratricopeptide (TPR) repeat protein
MSSELANKLLSAESLEVFLGEQAAVSGPQILSELKSEVDRLVGCDLHSAARLTGRIEQLAELIADPAARAFADASRARVLHYSGRPLEANERYEAAVNGLKGAGLVTEAALIRAQQVFALTQMDLYTDAETNVGNIYYRLDQYRKALKHYDRARETFRAVGDDAMRALVDFSRSNILTELDRPEEAMELLESAAASFDGAGQAAIFSSYAAAITLRSQHTMARATGS